MSKINTPGCPSKIHSPFLPYEQNSIEGDEEWVKMFPVKTFHLPQFLADGNVPATLFLTKEIREIYF